MSENFSDHMVLSKRIIVLVWCSNSISIEAAVVVVFLWLSPM